MISLSLNSSNFNYHFSKFEVEFDSFEYQYSKIVSKSKKCYVKVLSNGKKIFIIISPFFKKDLSSSNYNIENEFDFIKKEVINKLIDMKLIHFSLNLNFFQINFLKNEKINSFKEQKIQNFIFDNLQWFVCQRARYNNFIFAEVGFLHSRPFFKYLENENETVKQNSNFFNLDINKLYKKTKA